MLTDTVERPADLGPPSSPVPVAVASAPPAAQRIGRYAVLRQLGEGGMGVVLAAYDEELDRRVAVKLLREHGAHAFEHRMRIFREAQAMARVSHPNVVQVYEVGEFSPPGSRESQVFIAMEFIDGVTLYDWQRQDGRAWEEILGVYLAAGQGLRAAHDSGLVHRDFKPDNVLVGSDGRPRVADFGLARGGDDAADKTPPVAPAPERSAGFLLRSPLTQAGAILGTPMYMSPEQYRGELAGPRSDQFSFCVALYEALYGVPPFDGSTFEALRANVLLHRVRPRPAGTAVPPFVHETIVRGMALDPEQRFASMAELLAALTFDPGQNPAALPLIRRAFSAILLALSVGLVSLFLGPTLRNQNTVRMALASSVILFFGLGLATLVLRKILLRNAFHRGIVILILSLAGQEALISAIAYLMNATVAQAVAMELAALVAVIVSLTYFFFRRGWVGIPVVLGAIGYLLYSPQDAGLVAMLVHVLFAAAVIWLWGRSGRVRGIRQLDLPSQ
jgi:serine/threonine protein kinase